MNFKLFKLRTKIFYYSFIGKIQQKIPQLDLELQGHDSKRILLMFPFDEPSFRVAAFSFRGLGSERQSENNYTFLIKDSFKPLFHIRRGETIILISDPKDPSKIKSEDSIINVLKVMDFDMVIDLNTNFYLDASRILSLIPSKMKVGFKSRFSDLFYNIQLDISRSGITENGYQKVQLMLENS
jgi:hypothetical protein